MDEYDKKFAEMQKYIPFLEAMIERLQNVKDKSREVQLQKMQSLHGILSNSKRKLKIETLQRCEDVLQKLHNKVEKGNTPGLQFPNKKGDGGSTQLSTPLKGVTSDRSQDAGKKTIEEKLNETPASPSPPMSPASGSQIVPIIIPTERSDYRDDKRDSKPSSPDQINLLPAKAPIIIPTERSGSTPSPSSNSSQKNADDVSFSEWDMLEECENTNIKSSNWHLQGKNSDGLSHISTTSRPLIPPGDVARRISLVLEKARLQAENTDARGCEAKTALSVNIPDNRLHSPDSEHSILKHKGSSPRLKDPNATTKAGPKPPAPLLLSPPPVSTAPPLSMEDLAELLSDAGEGKTEKKTDKVLDDSSSKRDVSKQESNAGITPNRDQKNSKTFMLHQDDLDKESERQWEEVHKHIVKFPSKKSSSNTYSAPVCNKYDPTKPVDGKGPTTQPGSSHPTMGHRYHSLPQGSEVGPRYADNYERRPRQLRDTGIHENMKDKLSGNMYCRLSEEELSVPPHRVSPSKPDDRLPLYQRRQSNKGPDMGSHRPESDFRMDGPDYFGRQMPNAGHWPPMHGNVNSNEFCKSNWAPNGNYNMPNPPVQSGPYQHPMGLHQQEMWNSSSMNPVHTEPHLMNEASHRTNQYSPNTNSGIMPLMSPTAHTPDKSHGPRGDSMHEDLSTGPTIQPLMSPTNFPMGSQFHNFQGESRSYEQPFDRGMEYPQLRSSGWDTPGKGVDAPFRGEGDGSVVVSDVTSPSTSGSFPRTSTPCPWSRERDRGRSRGRDSYYNDRNRTETRTNFNREVRRPEWAAGGHSEWDTRFNRDSRSVSERDPRIRLDHNVSTSANQNMTQAKDNSNSTAIRDPRLAKDKHSSSAKPKDSSYSDRDPRKRHVSSTSSEKSQTFSPRKTKEDKLKDKPKSPKGSDSHKKTESESMSRAQQEKLAKEKAQSSLESLYGVIDTKAKAVQGSLLNFKIPKIKRSESQNASFSNNVDKTEEKLVEKVEERVDEKVDEKANEKIEDKIDGNKEDDKKTEKDDGRVEVTSSSDGNIQEEDWEGDSSCWLKDDTKAEENVAKTLEPTLVEPVKIGEADSVMDIAAELPTTTEISTPKEEPTNTPKAKEEVTQEYIETLIKKSLESGEGKKLVEQAKLMQKLSEALEPKKLKRIKKILESETESSSSEKEAAIELKKLRTRKKIRRIVSDSSDEECLADRLRSCNNTPAPEVKDESSNRKESLCDSKAVVNESLDKSVQNTALETDSTEKSNVDFEGCENDTNSNANKSTESKSTAEETKDVVMPENQEPNESDVRPKTPKPKAKRRNSLEMLQEDIREMFICDEVVTATGYRVCRMQKENQSNAPATTSNQPSAPVTKKDEPPTKQDVDANANKSKPKAKTGRKPRHRAKRVILSSDSEEDQPLVLRAALFQSSLVLSNDEDTRDKSQFESQRRGRRVIKRETLKEPRVVLEKTEISKQESSKASFDSSSEEDFSIDVSKLTAAVDNSLLLEKHSDQEVSKKSEVSAFPLTEKSDVCKDNLSTGKAKPGDAESFSSEGSAPTAAVTRSKAAELSFNEELLSNILVGLVPSKSESPKTTSIDKGDEADVDEDTNEQQPEDQGTKKSITKKKKKKWRMGILSKKKRKRAHAPSPKNDSTLTQTSLEFDTSSKLDNSSDVLEDGCDDKVQKSLSNAAVPTDTESTKDSLRDDNAEEDSNSKKEESAQQTLTNDELPLDTGETPPETETILKEKPKETTDKVEDTVEKESKEIVSQDQSIENKKAQELNAVYGTLREFSINQWTEYVLTGQDRYRCWICFFTGKNIVHHYKVQHPGAEILISRLKVPNAKAAIAQAEREKLESVTPTEFLMAENCKFTCRICSFSAEGARSHAKEAFYEHYTTHTGEYRFRCNYCPYQSVAKGSMRTHFYKLCRKFTRVFTDCTTEDDIPAGLCVYGYLCTVCNFVQLMRGNVEKHVSFWHPDDPNAKIVKINMSAEPLKEEQNVLVDRIKTEDLTSGMDASGTSVEDIKIEPHKLEITDDNDELQKYSQVTPESDDAMKIDIDKVDPDSEEKDGIIKPDEEMQKKSEAPEDSLICSTKLSVFVCPPELENKEMEIQLERKKKMEKIIEDIGIKLNQSALKKGFSITDQLTNKMKNDLEVANAEAPEASTSVANVENDSSILTTPIPPEKSAVEADIAQSAPPSYKDTEIYSSEVKETATGDSLTDKSELLSQPSSELSADTEKSDTKVRDPLISIVDQKKDDESESDTSDNENARDSAPLYDFESSSEQSESELSPDVNMLLMETSTISGTSKDPMLTTIQRLAAKLQATKPNMESSSSESAQSTFEKDTCDANSQPPVSNSSTINMSLDDKAENSQSKASSFEMQFIDENSGKSIRLRRLSGDMLSISNEQDDSMASRSDGDQTNSSIKVDSILQSDTDEECSFLKIENVVSLAPSANSSCAESPLITDIRKAVETSPIKLGVSVLKRSNCPLILKRGPIVVKSPTGQKGVPGVQTSPKETVKLIPLNSGLPTVSKSPLGTRTSCFIPIAPKSRTGETKLVSMDTSTLVMPRSVIKTTAAPVVNARTMTIAHQSPQGLNYKIVKLLRQPNILKPRESSNQPPAMKLKSPEAYGQMLTPAKLSHFYKCMARDCHFTTDILISYFQHYQQHASEAEKKNSPGPPYDYQKCPYCYTSQENWNQMKMHLEEKHEHCRYQCGFCFYRSIVLSYARVHQELSHPGSKRVIVCKVIKDPRFLKDEFNRYEFIHPFVCQHECRKIFYVPEAFVAHLKSKHAAVTTVFKCHLCTTTFAKIDQLLTHYKIHGFYKYQCLYCLHGADAYEELHSHLSTFHYNKIPQILERSLPARIIRGKDVIQQLIIKQFDEPMGPEKCNEAAEFITLASTTHQSKQGQSPKTEATVIGKSDAETVKKPMHGILWQLGSQNNKIAKTTITSAQLEKAQSDGRKETISIRDILANEANNQLTQLKTEDEVKTVKTFFSGGKIITVNLLNNSGSLRTASHEVSNAAVSSSTTADDSDIEILEETIDKPQVKPTNLESVLNTTEKPKLAISTKAEPCEAAYGSNLEDSNQFEPEPVKTIVKSPKAPKPLTLDDIKHTGSVGVDLYRCGYKSCTYGARNVSQFKGHVKQCSKRGQQINCVHCNKQFVRVGCLVEHLKLHGLKRFGCSLCSVRFSVSYQALAHMKNKHKVIGTKLVPADPTNPSANGLFIVQRWNDGGQRKRKRRKSMEPEENDEPSEKIADIEKSSFKPDEIEQLPRQAIYSREVQCAVCPYTTKVRTNIIRHLQLHAQDASVPESGPVNPVPCLDKKERMFDKMVNLASSSHQNGRMGAKSKESPRVDDNECIPKFIPEHKRYVCGVTECNYLTVDEAMLRYHLKALHSDELYFRCPHCPQPVPGQESLSVAIDKMGIHLKMHDARLYKCSHCNYHHYHRHVVERHLTDKHPEKRPFVKVIRELESTENVQQSVQEEAEEEIPDPDGNHWKCNICEYKCVYKAEMITHANSMHDEKYQFKCTLCTFKTSGKILFEQHIISKHNNDPNVDFILVYQRIKGVNKRNVENTEQGPHDEPFDTTPLWRRDMPRIRHIRGILLEEETNPSAEGTPKGTKRKVDTEITVGRPAKIKPVKSASFDDSKDPKEKETRSLSCDKLSSDPENSDEPATAQKESDSATPVTVLKTANKESNDPLDEQTLSEVKCGRFGPYGSPDGNQYVCTLCSQFRSKYKHDMRDHLYRELNYARWHCKECNHSSVNRHLLMKHCNKCHRHKQPKHEALSVDKAIEFWVRTLLRIQTSLMKEMQAKHNSAGPRNTFESISAPNKDDVKTSSPITSDHDLDVLSIDDISDLDSSINSEKRSGAKNETPEDQSGSEKAAVMSGNETGKPLTCKHCKMIFTRWRGFKLHVQLIHLKRLGFVCPYCDRSTNSETRMRQHVRAKHPGREEKIIQNPAAGGPELSSEFWEKEYGVVFPMKTRKRNKRDSVEAVPAEKDNNTDSKVKQEKCSECSFTAINYTGLKAHMRTHAVKPILKCSQCAFSSANKAEHADHWRISHPLLPFKQEALPVPRASTSTVEAPKEPPVPDYNEDIEEEVVPITTIEEDLTYACFYCSFRNKSKDVVKAHWSMAHKHPKVTNDSSTTSFDLPFRYKEVESPSILPQRARKTPPGSITHGDGADDMVFYDNNDIEIVEGAGPLDIGWICQWCNELCDCESKIKAHQNMFHSHLPLNFKRADGRDPPKGYCCPECPYTTTFIHLMKNHIPKHINLFKCKYCERTFSAAAYVASHTAEEHPGLEVKINSIPNFDFLTKKLMARVQWITWEEYIDKKFDQIASPNKHGVAKKSTAKSSILASPLCTKLKAVARKSITPLPLNYSYNPISKPSELVSQPEQHPMEGREFSFYGVPQPPVNLAQLNTYMVVGGHRMKVKCITLAQLININPKVMIEDLKCNPEYTSFLSELD